MRDRTALVTGANRGLGRAVAEALAARGAKVIVGARERAAGEEVAAEIREKGGDADVLVLDVARGESIDRALGALRERGRRVDVLVNNAGIYEHGDALTVEDARFRASFEVHVFGPLRLACALVPAMKAAGWGRVVNVSSGYGSFGEGGIAEAPAAYGVSKAALNALTVALAAAAGPAVKVNAVCPGWVRTRMGGPDAHRSIEEGSAGIVQIATLPDDGPTGGFFRDGKPIPW